MKLLLKRSLALLRLRNVAEQERSIEILKEECFKRGPITIDSISKFKALIKLRSVHTPIQYLCRSWPFRDLNLKLERPILIPRFESEYMIEILIEKINNKYDELQRKEIKFVEFGCGSGALGLSICKEIGIKGTMIDIKSKCIELTVKNMKLNNIGSENLTVIEKDMINCLHLFNEFQIIISNPPYLSFSHYKKYLKKQIKDYEDIDALVASDDGMKYIKMLIGSWQKKQGNGIMILEFDGRELIGELCWVNDYVVNDQYGKRRFILLEK